MDLPSLNFWILYENMQGLSGLFGNLTVSLTIFFSYIIGYTIFIFQNSFSFFILFEIFALLLAIIESKFYAHNYGVSGGFGTVMLMFKTYIKIHINLIVYFYRFCESLINISIRIATVIAEAIPG